MSIHKTKPKTKPKTEPNKSKPHGTVLLTRPAGKADALLARLAQRGISAESFPLLTLSPCPNAQAELLQCLAQLPPHSLVISVSRPASQYANAVMAQSAHDGVPAQWRGDLCYFAVGAGSAGEWALPWPVHTGKEPTSEGLLDLEQLQSVAGRKILILRGVGGRELLADTLSQRGAKVSYCELYQRQAPVLTSLQREQIVARWQSGGIATIVVTSGAILDNLQALVPAEAHDWLHGLPLIVISKRLVKMAQDRGFTRVICARGADDASLETCITRLLRHA